MLSDGLLAADFEQGCAVAGGFVFGDAVDCGKFGCGLRLFGGEGAEGVFAEDAEEFFVFGLGGGGAPRAQAAYEGAAVLGGGGEAV